jgi:hypothetical protein
MGQFLGFVELENALQATILVAPGNVPTNLTALPSYRIYSATGLVLSGSFSPKDTDPITAASNASPIAVTSTAHGLTTGTAITISGVLGNTNANGSWIVTVVDPNTFTLNGSTGNGAYSGGGSWSVTGLYTAAIAATSANGFLEGQCYTLLVQGAVGAVAYADMDTFMVT